MATVADVAHRAEVSASTVSRYLSGQLRLSPDTERRIRDAIDALGYVPNSSARRLAGVRTGVIGLVLPSMSNGFFASFADEVATVASERDLTLMLCSTRDSQQNEERYTDLLASRAVDGMIYLGMHPENRRLQRAVADGMPVVVVDELIDETAGASTVTVDNFSGAFQATQHLISRGHRRIAYVGGPPSLSTERERRRGFEMAMQRAGIVVDDELVLSGQYSEAFGLSALPHLVTAEDRPTAVFCASDSIAVGLISATDGYGIQVPQDLSVVGFDDAQIASYLKPRLTTVRQPVAELARRAVSMLTARLDGDGPTHSTLPVELVIRDSVQSPAQHHTKGH